MIKIAQNNQSKNLIMSETIKGYILMDDLGGGTFGEARLAERLSDHKRFCVKIEKIISKDNRVYTQSHNQALEELEFHQKYNRSHPFIIGFEESFNHPELKYGKERLCLVLELADSGDLQDAINNKGEYDEGQCIAWIAQIALALSYLHSRDLMHRDLKPGNILLNGKHKLTKLCDFGTYKQQGIMEESMSTVRVGTFEYFAPERFTGLYGPKIDVWSLGVILYELVTGGRHPLKYDFKVPQTLTQLSDTYPNAKFNEIPSSVSPQCQALIKYLLQKDPDLRPTIDEVLQTPPIMEQLKLITQKQVYGKEIAILIQNYLDAIDIDLLALTEIQTGVSQSTAIVSPSQGGAGSIPQAIKLPQANDLPTIFSRKKIQKLLDLFKRRDVKGLFLLQSLGWHLPKLPPPQDSHPRELLWLTNFQLGDHDGLYYGQALASKPDGLGLLLLGGACYLYECLWHQGIPLQGRCIHWTGDIYVGQFDSQLRKHGSGSRQYNDGSSYEGGWQEGQWHGRGRYVCKSGGCYEGAFVNGGRRGEGVVREGGREYQGIWVSKREFVYEEDNQTYKRTYKSEDSLELESVEPV
ncbi:hypothetical protein FGO68_gene17439 [Halteria grandinella]|uniref:Protein kinase domain-containing protein n=1 Tax=Halteria grandinella TaxID=5974 RepID=A0A8J8NUJ4_HALGN|nr:hypothetical protein FGO68_gene17439 [Halteria grandinella]